MEAKAGGSGPTGSDRRSCGEIHLSRGKTLSVDSVEYASGGAAWRLARLYS